MRKLSQNVDPELTLFLYDTFLRYHFAVARPYAVVVSAFRTYIPAPAADTFGAGACGLLDLRTTRSCVR